MSNEEERFCMAEAHVDAHAFASADGNDWPTLTCSRLPDHDGLHYDEMNLVEWASVEVTA